MNLLFFVIWLVGSESWAKVLVTHNGHILDKAGGQIETGTEWISVHPMESKSVLKKVKIYVSAEKRFEDTPYWEVSTPEPGLFLVKGVELKVKSIPSAPKYGADGPHIFKEYEPTEIKFGNFKVQYYSTFGVSKTEYDKNPKIGRKETYTLVLDADGRKLEMKMSAVIRFPYKIVWMGDLNIDGIPDVLVRPHHPEKIFHSTFFMSEKKNDRYRMIEVGTYPSEIGP